MRLRLRQNVGTIIFILFLHLKLLLNKWALEMKRQEIELRFLSLLNSLSFQHPSDSLWMSLSLRPSSSLKWLWNLAFCFVNLVTNLKILGYSSDEWFPLQSHSSFNLALALYYPGLSIRVLHCRLHSNRQYDVAMLKEKIISRKRTTLWPQHIHE